MNLKGLLENKEDREWEKNREARKGEGKHKQGWEEIEEENRKLGKGFHTRVLHGHPVSPSKPVRGTHRGEGHGPDRAARNRE